MAALACCAWGCTALGAEDVPELDLVNELVHYLFDGFHILGLLKAVLIKGLLGQDLGGGCVVSLVGGHVLVLPGRCSVPFGMCIYHSTRGE